MKILIVNDYSQNVGGTEAYIRTISKALEERGHCIEYYYGSDDYNISRSNRARLSSFINRIFSIKHFLHFRTAVREFKPDVIHLQNIFNELSPSILVGLPKIPIIMTVHDYQIVQAVFDMEYRNGKKCTKMICPGCINCVGFKGAIYERIKRTIHRFLLSRIKVFVAPSKWCERVLKESKKGFNVTQIYNGIKLEKPFKFLNSTNILYSGRLTEDKGVNYLIEALPNAIAQIPNLTITMAGEGNLRDELKSRIKQLKLESNVKFLGFLPKPRLYEEYHQCSVVIVPSIWPENLPTVCIEALSLGRPVLASRVGGIPEIVSQNVNGILIDPKDSSAISNALVDLFSTPGKLRKMSMNAPVSIAQFDINCHVDKLISLYKSK